MITSLIIVALARETDADVESTFLRHSIVESKNCPGYICAF